MLVSQMVLLAFTIVLATARVFPTPKQEVYHQGSLQLDNPCHLFLSAPQEHQYYFDKVIARINKGVACQKELLFRPETHTRVVTVHDSSLSRDAYGLEVNEDGVTLSYSQYPGYIYAL